MQAATHSGKFHADDVLAWAMLSQFLDQDCTLIRTRDPEILQQADIVFDVGGEYDVQSKRFDHHQNEYQGPLSSAGMVLIWLFNEGKVSDTLYARLKSQIVDYVDAVDNGRLQPDATVPCFTRIVDSLNKNIVSMEDFDAQFFKAAHIASLFIDGLMQEELAAREAEQLVVAAMNDAEKQQCSFLEFPKYLSWKSTYFANGGKDHPTHFVLFPTLRETWKVVAIPPEEHSFGQKRPLPMEWAGRRDDDLSSVTLEESIFCHKNRFIAVFKTRGGAIRALKRFNLLSD